MGHGLDILGIRIEGQAKGERDYVTDEVDCANGREIALRGQGRLTGDRHGRRR